MTLSLSLSFSAIFHSTHHHLLSNQQPPGIHTYSWYGISALPHQHPSLRGHTHLFSSPAPPYIRVCMVWALSPRSSRLFACVCVRGTQESKKKKSLWSSPRGGGRKGRIFRGWLSLSRHIPIIHPQSTHTHTPHHTRTCVCVCVCVCCFFPVLCCPTTHTHLNRVGCSVFVGHQRHPLVLRSVPSFPRRVPGARELTHPVGYIYTRRRVFFV
jgi:hypothetical protein